MLSKILKYEIPALGRKLGPLYIACMVTSVMFGLAISSFDSGKSEAFTIIPGMLYGFAITAAIVMMIFTIIQRFQNNLFGDGAYFSHALPVGAGQHIAGKLIGGLIWVLLGVIAFLITGLIIAAFDTGAANVINTLVDIVKDMISVMDWRSFIIGLEVILMVVGSAAKSILMIYAAITIGQLARKHTTLAALGSYIGVVILETLFGKYVLATPFVRLYSTFGSFSDVNAAFLATIAVIATSSAVYFVITERLMSKHLNLA